MKKTQPQTTSLRLPDPVCHLLRGGKHDFPPAMGQLAGDNFLAALAGFILTDAGIAILGMIAVVLVGSSMSDLGSLVSKKFALCLSVGIYLLIGPLFAMSRTGSASLAAW